MTAPRISHNAKLADEVVAKLRMTSRFPKVSLQLETVPIEPGRLVRFGYNPSIIEDEGMLTMAYRYHDGDTLATRLALAQISFDGKVISNRALAGNGLSMEDPKLFWFQNQLYISWVEATYPNFPLKSVVKYAKMVDGKLGEPILPKLPGNDLSTMQKNYVFFAWDSRLYVIYRRYPQQQIYQVDGENVVAVHENIGIYWPFGEPRGGTPPLPYNDRLISFFHSGLDNEFSAQRRRYYMGAMVMENEPPFRPVKISWEPILFGSEVDDIPLSEWPKCRHRKPQVVFPGGAVHRGDHWLVSVGVNDYECVIVKVTEKDLKL